MGIRQRLTICLLSAASPLFAETPCVEDELWLRGAWGEARFQIEIADDAVERGRGLMFVEEMPRQNGMLFVYDHPQSVAFWMKNTLIPLDMIFADQYGVVQKVHSNAIPGDLTAIPGGQDIQFVLEINGGLATKFGINPGSEMRHLSINHDDAVWSCED